MACYASTVVNLAKGEVGYLEKASNKSLDSKTANAGSANYTKYGRDMHKIAPNVMDFPAAWCDAFVDDRFVKAYGEKKAKELLCGAFNDYTPSSAQLYKNAGRYGKEPKFGAQIFFKNSTRINHTGIVTGFDKTYVYTVEGNTSGASGVIPNGGGVCEKKYKLTNSKIDGYGYPAYDPEPVKEGVCTVEIKVLKKGAKGKEVVALQTLLIGYGFSCGSTGADGSFGGNTLKAVKAYQKSKGLAVDGSVGPATWGALLGLN